MLTYPHIDPVAVAIGPLKVRWYGLMYLAGFVMAWWLGRARARRPDCSWTPEQVDDVIFYSAIGVVFGGRLGYVLFYGWDNILADPRYLYRIWEGGMSFHGGLLGVMLAIWLLARKQGRHFWDMGDFASPLVPLGLFAGRVGNFINGELWGKPTEVPWAFIVDGVGRHPSQLYEAFLEGLVLFAILWLYSARPRPRMAISGMFLVCYGVFRFAVEFVRVPDEHLDYLALDWVTMGQVLSTPMILVGCLMLLLAYWRRPESGNWVTA